MRFAWYLKAYFFCRTNSDREAVASVSILNADSGPSRSCAVTEPINIGMKSQSISITSSVGSRSGKRIMIESVSVCPRRRAMIAGASGVS